MDDQTTCAGSNDDPRTCPRGHWRPAEDEKLRQLVQQYGPQNWNSIAEKLQGRSGRNLLDFVKHKGQEPLACDHGQKAREKSKLCGSKRTTLDQDNYNVALTHSKSPTNYIFRRKNSRLQEDHDQFGSKISFENGGILDLHTQNKDKIFSMSSFSGSYAPWPNNLSPDLFGTKCYKSPSSASIGSNNYQTNFSIFSPNEDSVAALSNKRAVSNTLSCLDYGSRINREYISIGENSLSFGKTRTSVDHQQHEEKKNVPFIDFLGVGISS
ncbi:UNVERIFIED_CONTAM: Transcription factor [Sesamum latifolium]|uniref:Transcription factor n=1 Tax=Sesamum latifolium TaxID=2727402 RepID=A0AAW2W8X8_9LAMI